MYDAEIRSALRADVQRCHTGDDGTAIVDELGLRQGQVRVDLAVVNGTFTGYEIKSQADTLRRLPTQVEIYSQVLDYAAIVLAECHRDDACEIVPGWWGIVIARCTPDGVELDRVRSGELNPSVDKRALAELLWHAEALDLLRRKGTARGLSGKPRAAAWDRLAETCTLDEVRSEVRARVKVRASRPRGT